MKFGGNILAFILALNCFISFMLYTALTFLLYFFPLPLLPFSLLYYPILFLLLFFLIACALTLRLAYALHLAAKIVLLALKSLLILSGKLRLIYFIL